MVILHHICLPVLRFPTDFPSHQGCFSSALWRTCKRLADPKGRQLSEGLKSPSFAERKPTPKEMVRIAADCSWEAWIFMIPDGLSKRFEKLSIYGN